MHLPHYEIVCVTVDCGERCFERRHHLRRLPFDLVRRSFHANAFGNRTQAPLHASASPCRGLGKQFDGALRGIANRTRKDLSW